MRHFTWFKDALYYPINISMNTLNTESFDILMENLEIILIEDVLFSTLLYTFGRLLSQFSNFRGFWYEIGLWCQRHTTDTRYRYYWTFAKLKKIDDSISCFWLSDGPIFHFYVSKINTTTANIFRTWSICQAVL